MGAWDAGSFNNDTALDWVFDVCKSGDVAIVRRAFVRVMEERRVSRPPLFRKLFRRPRKSEPYLEARVACEGLAAAEIVAFWLGHPDKHFPDDLGEWARRHASQFDPEFLTLARQAISVIKTKSELKDLWEQQDGTVDPDWDAAIADLERRLQN